MDITELILLQHHEQRRMFALLDEIDRDDADQVAPLWSRLKVLLESHAAAEEKFFYPGLLAVGRGAGGEDSAASESKDAIKDHNEIRDAVREASAHPVASSGFWQSVQKARIANSDHMAEEEREDLPDFRRHATLAVRHRIGVEFVTFQAQHADGVSAHNRDPQEFVTSHQG